jgi:hypothetical protein
VVESTGLEIHSQPLQNKAFVKRLAPRLRQSKKEDILENVWLPLVAGFLGVLVGSMGQVITVCIQSRAERQRERDRLAIESAIAEYTANLRMAELHVSQGRSVSAYPLSSAIAYNKGILDLLAKDRLTPERVLALRRNIEELDQVAAIPIDQLKTARIGQ